MMGHVDKILKGPVKKARLMLLPSTKDPHAAEYLPRESGDCVSLLPLAVSLEFHAFQP
jgi:hypothetical protein